MTTPFHNQVLVRPNGDLSVEYKEKTGVNIQNPFERYNTLSIEGVVVSLPDTRGVYFGDEADRLRRGQFTFMPRELMEIGLRENAGFEIEVGDSVLFHYRYLLNDREPYEKDGDFFSIHYSDLLAKVNKDGSLYPLNGQVLVTKHGNYWEVVAEGAKVKGYADGSFPDTDADWPKLVGMVIAADKSAPVAIEGKFFCNYNVGDNRIFIIHRKHINGFQKL